MKKIHKLNKSNFNQCTNLFVDVHEEGLYFQALGWNENQIFKQLSKITDYSIGIFENKELLAFVLGDLIFIEKVSEYEILFIYVKKNYRNQGLASRLLKTIYLQKNIKNLNKIFLEVADDNKEALRLYKSHNFKLLNIRKNYYQINNNQINALCFIKNL